MALRDDLIRFVNETLIHDGNLVGPDDSLIDRGIVDSIGLMQLMSFVEERTGRRIPDHMVTPENFQSIESMEKMLESLSKPDA